MAQPAEQPESVIARPFGAENRARLITQWFGLHDAPTPTTAWEHVYRLLLWIDVTTGLAHCYESDKSQPGKHWYKRTLAFHEWVSTRLGASPAGLGDQIDWMFKRAIEDLTCFLETQREQLLTVYKRQREPYEGKGLPEPGDNPELREIIELALADFLLGPPPLDVWRTLTERIYTHFGQENKRKNLVGEGFEDVLAALVAHLPSAVELVPVTRKVLHEIPGFNRPRGREKVKRVDLTVLKGPTQSRTLVTAKWSVRADREEQFATDFAAYVSLEAAGQPFDYVLVTNEFDPARLLAACDRLAGNQRLFTEVVHVNPGGVLAAYGPDLRDSAREVVKRIEEGRLLSLEAWLSKLTSAV